MDVTDKLCPRCKIRKPKDQGFYNNKTTYDGKDNYCKRCRHAVTAEYAKKRSPEQVQRHKDQKIEYFLRKYGVPFQPHSARPEVKRKREENAARRLSRSANTSQQTRDGELSASRGRLRMA